MNLSCLRQDYGGQAEVPVAFEYTEKRGWTQDGWTLQSFESLETLDTESVKTFEQPSTIWAQYSIPSFDYYGMPSRDR